MDVALVSLVMAENHALAIAIMVIVIAAGRERNALRSSHDIINACFDRTAEWIVVQVAHAKAAVAKSPEGDSGVDQSKTVGPAQINGVKASSARSGGGST